jgi:hypothetical protein
MPVTGHGGIYGYEMLRIPHCLNCRFTDGDEVQPHTPDALYSPEKFIFLSAVVSSVRGLVNSSGIVQPEELGKLI